MMTATPAMTVTIEHHCDIVGGVDENGGSGVDNVVVGELCRIVCQRCRSSSLFFKFPADSLSKAGLGFRYP